jgi:tetratricopeptide (TPR) repeat protein
MDDSEGRHGQVRGQRARIWFGAGACLVALFFAGIRRDETVGATYSSSTALRLPLLPDLAGVTGVAPLRERIATAFLSLESRRQDASTSSDVLAEAYGELGIVLLAADYAGAAEICYLDAFTLAPQDYRWAYYLGHAHRTLGDLVTAARYFNQSLQMAPDYVPAHVWFGELTLAWGRPELSELAFTAALSYQPRSQAALFGLGRTKLAQRNLREAVGYLERALAVDPHVSGIRYPLALAYRGLGDIQAAQSHMRHRGDVQPALPDPLMENVARLRTALPRIGR